MIAVSLFFIFFIVCVTALRRSKHVHFHEVDSGGKPLRGLRSRRWLSLFLTGGPRSLSREERGGKKRRKTVSDPA